MSASDPVVIVGMARTPMGAMLGELAGFSANELGAHAIKRARHLGLLPYIVK